MTIRGGENRPEEGNVKTFASSFLVGSAVLGGTVSPSVDGALETSVDRSGATSPVRHLEFEFESRDIVKPDFTFRNVVSGFEVTMVKARVLPVKTWQE